MLADSVFILRPDFEKVKNGQTSQPPQGTPFSQCGALRQFKTDSDISLYVFWGESCGANRRTIIDILLRLNFKG